MITTEDVVWVLAGAVLGLFINQVRDAVQMGRLTAQVEFLTTVSEQNLNLNRSA